MFQMHGMENLDLMGDPTGSMTTLTPMSETPISSSHHQLHGSYHSMNHMMSHHHHGGPLSGHTPGAIFLLTKFLNPETFLIEIFNIMKRLFKLSLFRLASLGDGCRCRSCQFTSRPGHRSTRTRSIRRTV